MSSPGSQAVDEKSSRCHSRHSGVVSQFQRQFVETSFIQPQASAIRPSIWCVSTDWSWRAGATSSPSSRQKLCMAPAPGNFGVGGSGSRVKSTRKMLFSRLITYHVVWGMGPSYPSFAQDYCSREPWWDWPPRFLPNNLSRRMTRFQCCV